MLEMARSRPTPPSLTDPPEWLRTLPGFDMFHPRETGQGLTFFPDGIDETVELPGGTWRVTMIMPVDLSLTEGSIDPVVLLATIANGAAKVDDKLQELVAFRAPPREIVDRDRSSARHDEAVGVGTLLGRRLTRVSALGHRPTPDGPTRPSPPSREQTRATRAVLVPFFDNDRRLRARPSRLPGSLRMGRARSGAAGAVVGARRGGRRAPVHDRGQRGGRARRDGVSVSLARRVGRRLRRTGGRTAGGRTDARRAVVVAGVAASTRRGRPAGAAVAQRRHAHAARRRARSGGVRRFAPQRVRRRGAVRRAGCRQRDRGR